MAILQSNKDFVALKRKSILIVISWTLLCFLAAYWNIATEKEKTLELAQKEARTVVDKDQAFRFWATNKSGVYVPASETTPPNEYLSHIVERDIVTPGGQRLTLMNPAYMLRQVMGQYATLYSVKGHITSLKVLNPINEPDEWEIKALQELNNGKEEVMAVEVIGGNQFLRFMKPMYTQVGCLKCHAQQGFKEGDMLGGVSVSVPLAPYLEMETKSLQKIYITNLFFWLSGIIVVIFTFYRSKKGIIERLDAARSLQEYSEKIKLFAYSVAHDLKNPAIAIHGLTKLMRKNYQDVLDEKGKHFCEEIIKSSTQISSLVEQINVYISAKEHPITIEELDFLAICHTVKEEYLSQLQERNIIWSEPEQISKIRADRMAILRIIRNLIDNALKYGGDALGKIEIDYKESEKFHTISVMNDGNALSPDDCQKLFTAFKRSATDTKIEGAGLGLAIIKELVGQHYGEVWGESDGKKGVIFCFTISKKL